MRNAVNFKSLSAIVRYSANATIPEHLTRSTMVSLIIPAFNPSLQGNDGTYTGTARYNGLQGNDGRPEGRLTGLSGL